MKKRFLLLITIFMVLSISCSKDEKKEPEPEPVNLYDYASEESDLSIFTEAIVATGLDAELKTNPGLTVLAPDNTSFQAFLNDLGYVDLQAFITARGVENVKNWLSYHLINGEIRSDAFATTYIPTMGKNQKGDLLHMYVQRKSQTEIEFNGGPAELGESDIKAENGYLHKINSTLSLPTIGTLIKANPDFSYLLQLVNYSNSSFFLSIQNEGIEHTFFAADNNAFNRLFMGLGAYTNIPSLLSAYGQTGVTDILLYHNIISYTLAADFTNNLYSTGYAANSLAVKKDTSGNIILTDAKGRDIQVTLTNIIATDGVIHFTNNILLPY